MNKEKGVIYVDIESLLDIRQGILHKLVEEEKLVEYLNSDEYNLRDIDEFSIVNMDDYRRLYNEKPVDILKYSTITYIINVLNSKVVNLEKRNGYYGEKRLPEVLLNIYPFNLDKATIELIQNALFIKLNKKTYVEIISISNKDLSPFFIKNSSMVTCLIYNFQEWISAHADSLREVKLLDTVLYFPSIYYNKGTKEDIQYIKNLGFKDIFSYVEFLIAEYAIINFLPTVFYSNIMTSSLYADQFNKILVKKELDKETNNANSSTEI